MQRIADQGTPALTQALTISSGVDLVAWLLHAIRCAECSCGLAWLPFSAACLVTSESPPGLQWLSWCCHCLVFSRPAHCYGLK